MISIAGCDTKSKVQTFGSDAQAFRIMCKSIIIFYSNNNLVRVHEDEEEKTWEL